MAGLPSVALALHGGAAVLLKETTGRTVVPLGRRHASPAAVHGDFDDQIENLGRKAEFVTTCDRRKY